MQVYMVVAEGYRLMLDISSRDDGHFGWSLHLALSTEAGSGTPVADQGAFTSAVDAEMAGMRALEAYRIEQHRSTQSVPTAFSVLPGTVSETKFMQ
jgi:hypothetical protein